MLDYQRLRHISFLRTYTIVTPGLKAHRQTPRSDPLETYVVRKSTVPSFHDVESQRRARHGVPSRGGERLLGAPWLFGCEPAPRLRSFRWLRTQKNPDETRLSHWSCFRPRQWGHGEHAARCWGDHESPSTITNLTVFQDLIVFQGQVVVLLRFLVWKSAERGGRGGCGYFTAAFSAKLPFEWLTNAAGIVELWDWQW